MEEEFIAKQRKRKYEIRYFLRYCRKISFTEEETRLKLLRQLEYLECYYELVDLLFDVLIDGEGILRLRSSLHTTYNFLNDVAFKPLNEEGHARVSMIANLNLSNYELLGKSVDVFTFRNIEKLIDCSARLISLADNNTARRFQFRESNLS